MKSGLKGSNSQMTPYFQLFPIQPCLKGKIGRRAKVSKEEGAECLYGTVSLRVGAPQMLAVPAGWRLDLSLPGMQILHKLYTSDVGRRTCMRFDETSRRMEREARGQPNTAPSSLPPSRSFFLRRLRRVSLLCPRELP